MAFIVAYGYGFRHAYVSMEVPTYKGIGPYVGDQGCDSSRGGSRYSSVFLSLRRVVFRSWGGVFRVVPPPFRKDFRTFLHGACQRTFSILLVLCRYVLRQSAVLESR